MPTSNRWQQGARLVIALACVGLTACVSRAPVVAGGGGSALSPRQLSSSWLESLPPTGAGPSRPDAGSRTAPSLPPDAATADHATVLASIGLPPPPRAAIASAPQAPDPAVERSPSPQAAAVPVPVSAPVSAPVSVPVDTLPDGTVGAGIRAGQCWAQLWVEPVTRRQTVRVVTEDASTRLQVAPPELATQDRRVVVKDAAQTYRVEPPKFRQVSERVKVKDEVRRLVVVPAVYENRAEQVLVESARVVMESCRAPTQRAAGSRAVPTGMARCAREVPARFQTVTRRVLVQPETTREEVTPASYVTISKWVLDTPARAVEETLPETTQNVPLTAVVRPAQVQETPLPATTAALSVTRHEGMPQLVWRRALCESEAMPALVTRLQQALAAQGQEVGAPDGKLGRRTMAALVDYQRREGLAAGLITFETLQRLGLAVSER